MVHVPSGWCVCSEFVYGKVEAPLKLCREKDCVKKFCEHVIGEARRLYCSFPEVPMSPLNKAQLKKYEEARICHICFKPCNGENCYEQTSLSGAGDIGSQQHRNV